MMLMWQLTNTLANIMWPWHATFGTTLPFWKTLWFAERLIANIISLRQGCGKKTPLVYFFFVRNVRRALRAVGYTTWDNYWSKLITSWCWVNFLSKEKKGEVKKGLDPNNNVMMSWSWKGAQLPYYVPRGITGISEWASTTYWTADDVDNNKDYLREREGEHVLIWV